MTSSLTSNQRCTHFQQVGPNSYISGQATAGPWNCPWCESERLRVALAQLRMGIYVNAADTVWAGPGETAVDFITRTLGDVWTEPAPEPKPAALSAQGCEVRLYEAVGMHYGQAREVAELLAGGAVLWRLGHSWISEQCVVRPQGCQCQHCSPPQPAASNQLNLTPREIADFLASCRTLIAHSRTFYEVRDALAKAVAIIEESVPKQQQAAILPKLEYNPHCGECQRNKITVDVFSGDHPSAHETETNPPAVGHVGCDNSPQTRRDTDSVTARRDGTTRTPNDYAIEHGGYLAKAAEDFLTVLNDVAKAESALQTWGEDDPEYAAAKARVDRVWEVRHDHWSGLQSAIHEFRKRAERSRSAVETSPNQSALDLVLTTLELRPGEPFSVQVKDSLLSEQFWYGLAELFRLRSAPNGTAE